MFNPGFQDYSEMSQPADLAGVIPLRKMVVRGGYQLQRAKQNGTNNKPVKNTFF